MSLFDLSDRAKRLRRICSSSWTRTIYPAEAVYEEQMRESGDPHFQPPVLEELKAEARRRGLWNLFHPHPEWGPGLTNSRVRAAGGDHGAQPHLRSEACNCIGAGHGQHGGARRCSARRSTRRST